MILQLQILPDQVGKAAEAFRRNSTRAGGKGSGAVSAQVTACQHRFEQESGARAGRRVAE